MPIEQLILPWDPDGGDAIIPNLTLGSVHHSIVKWLSGERGVHAETLMVTIGALAGFAGQNAAFRAFGPPGAPIPDGALRMVEAGGERYYFGDCINGYLVRQKDQYAYPLWSFIVPPALKAGLAEKDLPDLNEIFAHVARSVGTPDFGIPRTTEGHPFHFPPRKALETFWPGTRALLSNADGVLVRGMGDFADSEEGRSSVPQAHWPVIMALVARKFVDWVSGMIGPQLALSLLMESAIPMSKVDPKTVPQTPPAWT